MTLDNLLLSKGDADSFRSHMVRIKHGLERVEIKPTDKSLTFDEMQKMRTTAALPFDMQSNLAVQGHVFANVGVSEILTITCGDKDYLIMTKQTREDRGDTVIKPVAGYVEGSNINFPVRHLWKEIAEKILPLTCGEVVRFSRGNLELMEMPYSHRFNNFHRTLELSDNPAFPLDRIGIPVHSFPGDDSRIYYHAPTNSGQLVYGYHLVPKEFDIEEIDSFYHAEQIFVEGMLETRVVPHGLVLVELEDGKMTDKVYCFEEGRRITIDPRDLHLAETFAPMEEGIVLADNIPFLQYVEQQ